MSRQTLELYPGQVLTVTATAVSSGHVEQDGLNPGDEPVSYTAVAANATQTFGPFANKRRFTIHSDVGELSYSVASMGALSTDNLSEEMSKITGWASFEDANYTVSNTFALTADTDFDIPIDAALNSRQSQTPDDVVSLGGFYIPCHLVVDDASGFTVGETITGGTSSDTAEVVSLDTTNNRIYITAIDGDFTDTETITGGTSAETATVSGTRVIGKVAGRDEDGINITIECKIKPTTANATLVDIWVDIGGGITDLYRRSITLSKGQNVEHGLNASFDAYTLDTWEANGGGVFIRCDNACVIYEQRIIITRTHKARAV